MKKHEKLRNLDIETTLDRCISSIKKTSTPKLIAIGIVLILLPLLIEIVAIFSFAAYTIYRNRVFLNNKNAICPELNSIADLVIITSEKIFNTGYSVKLTPENWNGTLGKVDYIKIIFVETELGKKLQAYVTYESGDNNKITLPKKSYFLEAELKDLILL